MCEQMFCFQCEQTAGGTGCAGKVGVCGKSAEVSGLQDALTGALVGLARAAESSAPTASTHRAMLAGLFATVTNVNFDAQRIRQIAGEVQAEKEKLLPGCDGCARPCSRSEDYDLEDLWRGSDADVRSLKSLLLFGLRGMAAYAWHALQLGFSDETVNAFFYKGMFAVGYSFEKEELLPLLLECGEANLQCMALLERANTESYGVPSPTDVSMTVKKGPFIIVSGHDLHDLYLLLKQTEGTGVTVYTHGEMLPAHAYAKLRAFPHLKGHFGTAWHNQQRELDAVPAPVLFTTNCLMPPKPSYSDRVFTTGVTAYPGMGHIGEDKDFTPVMEAALRLGGYREDCVMTGINGGSRLTTGFGRETVLGAAGQIVDAVKQGDIRHFFVVGGCDGARAGRGYYTEFVKKLPADTVVLTLGCGKYRFNDLALGEIGGLPRLLDMGQCNDAYGAVRVAEALAGAFGCGVNDLPLTLVLSWYEQKAVCILLSLLFLGIRGIYIGPTRPAFVSDGVWKILSESFGLRLTGEPEEDLRRIGIVQ